MRIDHGAKVRTKDGHDAGHLKHAIWDPSGEEIDQFVIKHRRPLGPRRHRVEGGPRDREA